MDLDHQSHLYDTVLSYDKEVDEAAVSLGDGFVDNDRNTAASDTEVAADVVDDDAAGVIAKFVVDGWEGAVKSDEDAAAICVGDVFGTGGAVAAANLVPLFHV